MDNKLQEGIKVRPEDKERLERIMEDHNFGTRVNAFKCVLDFWDRLHKAVDKPWDGRGVS